MPARCLTDPALGRCFPKVEACYARTWRDYHMNPHRHDRAEIMYVLRGQCEVTFPEGEAEAHRLGVGDFVFIDAGVAHTLNVDDSAYMVNTEFSLREHPQPLTLDALRQASPVLDRWLSRREAVCFGADPGGTLYQALSTIVDDFALMDKAESAMQALRMGQVLLTAANLLSDGGAGAKCLVHVRRCMQLLSEHLEDQVRVDDLAAALGVSASYLQRIFRQTQGMTIIEYLNRLRISRAKLLLTRTDDPIVDIAVASGFNSRQHFTRVFTQQAGLSPLQYRQKKRDAEQKQVFLF